MDLRFANWKLDIIKIHIVYFVHNWSLIKIWVIQLHFFELWVFKSLGQYVHMAYYNWMMNHVNFGTIHLPVWKREKQKPNLKSDGSNITRTVQVICFIPNTFNFLVYLIWNWCPKKGLGPFPPPKKK